MTDDGDNVGWYKFVADVPADLSSGRLYAAKFTQTSAANAGSFTISWVFLGAGGCPGAAASHARARPHWLPSNARFCVRALVAAAQVARRIWWRWARA